jgi:hypothetical protein
LRRFNERCGSTFEPGSGVNAALRFRGSWREISFRSILTLTLSHRMGEGIQHHAS